jgi:hypothetical protein
MAYFTDDSLLPENMAPLMITAAPYGPMWLPEDGPPGYIPLTWDEQVKLPSIAIMPVQRYCTSTCATPKPDTSRRTSRSTASRSGAFAKPCPR